jgi:formylglycine-generating enzyme required for sulfatase activity
VPPEALVPGALVFAPDLSQTVYRGIADWWEYRPGATWQLPEGPGRGVVAHPDHPVVQVAWEDARAYADWVGKRLPTEAEWEFAARGGLDGADYAWGDRMRPDGLVMANTFEGRFPVGLPGKRPGTSAVGCYPPNGFGLLDMIGNVWEWTADFYAPPGAPAGCCAQSEADARTESRDPAQPDIEIPRKVVKGGSFLCSPDYCLRFRPAARQPQMIDTAAGHIGFRCVSGAGPGAVR